MQDSEGRLQQELLADARRQAEQIIAAARASADSELAAQRAEHAALRVARLDEAGRDAEARARAIHAQIGYQVQRRWLTLREEGFDQLFGEVLPRLEQGAGVDRERSLRQLLQEALEATGPTAVRIRLNPECAALLTDAVVAEVRALAWPQGGAQASVSRTIDSSLRPGVVVESVDGCLVFDNTYATRLVRLRSSLRFLAGAGLGSLESDADAHA